MDRRIPRFLQNVVWDKVFAPYGDYMRRCQHIIIPSESMREILVKQYGLKNNFTVIPTGIDLEAYRTANGKKIRKKTLGKRHRYDLSW